MQAEIHTETTSNPTNTTKGTFSGFIKRLFDILVSGLGLLVLSPFLGWIAWRVRRDSPGPVLFHGDRSGLNGKIFKIHKFRTMREEAESYNGLPITAEDDPRVTTTGRWLRETKFNELPQLWNVLVGEMSLVGPRPEDPRIVESWHTDVTREILSVRPGITSPASILYRNEESLLNVERPMDTYLGSIMPSKLRLDQLYVRHRSFWLDLDILFWTVILLFPKLGSINLPESLLFLGPFTRFFNRYLSWFLVDTTISLVSISIAGLFFRSFAPLDIGWPRAILVAVFYSFLFSITCAILKVNRINWANARGEDILALVPATFLATVIALVINSFVRHPYVIDPPFVPYGMIFMASLLSFMGFVVVRYRNRIFTGMDSGRLFHWAQMPVARERVLIIGGGESGQIANSLLTTGSYGNHFLVIGYVDDDMFKQDTRIRGIDVVGQSKDIPRLVEKYDIGIILFAIHNITPEKRKHLLEICISTPARTFLFPDVPATLNTLWNSYTQDSIEIHSGKHFPWEALHLKESDILDFPYNLPCELCLVRISPMEIELWLKELEELTEAGDIEGLRRMINKRRNQLQSDTVRQYMAFVVPKGIQEERANKTID